MIYLSQMVGTPVVDSEGEQIGTVNALGIATGEVFPRVTALAFQGPERTPFMISWRKYVAEFSADEVRLKVPSTDIRFSYLQPNEVLIARDLLNKQIVDTRGMKVVRVNDLKLSDTGTTLRLLGAEVGARGILRSLSPALEGLALRVSKAFGRDIPEQVIAWNYMDLLDRDLSDVKLSVSHKTLDELHPADIADIIEQLDPRLRAQVFAQLDDAQAAEAMAELDDDEMAARIVEDMDAAEAATMLSEMDPDDAAEIVGELGHEKAEKLLRLMGVHDRHAIAQLLGYPEDTAGRIMTSEFVAMPATATVGDTIERIQGLEEDFESVHYVYTLDPDQRLAGVVSLRRLIVSDNTTPLSTIAEECSIYCAPEADQEDVAEDIAKYNLLAMPVVDDDRKLLGIVTVDDALEVLQEEHEEDLQIAGSTAAVSSDDRGGLLNQLLASEMWLFFWAAGVVLCSMVARAITGSSLLGIAASVALPVALRTAAAMVRYATNSYLEYDEDDEDAPTLLGFALKGVAVALVFAATVLLVARGIEGMLLAAVPEGAAADVGELQSLSAQFAAMATGFRAAACAMVVSFATAPAYLLTLRRRDKAGKETSGTMLRIVSQTVALLLFVVVASMAFAGWVG